MTYYSQPHLTHSIVMVEPLDFGFNEQTGVDNEFQTRPAESQAEEIRSKALYEFGEMVNKLENNGLEITVLGKSTNSESVPDAVFPNNWFSTRSDGSLFIYPMKTPNRQAEVQIPQLTQALSEKGYQIEKIIDLREKFSQSSNTQILEGTGSLIFHHADSQVFAAISERCEEEAFKQFCNDFGYRGNTMFSQSSQGSPIYHTNVLMSCGDDFAVVATSILADHPDSAKSMTNLRACVGDVIEITESQMADSFCGNIIQLKNQNDEPCIVMSESAYKGFTSQQIKRLEKHGILLPCTIPTIEKIGGGSARCMIAENFLPKA